MIKIVNNYNLYLYLSSQVTKGRKRATNTMLLTSHLSELKLFLI